MTSRNSAETVSPPIENLVDCWREVPADIRYTPPMRIALLSSEVAPYAKTGGLADVAGALPAALRDLGHDVLTIMPFYRAVRDKGFQLESNGMHFEVPMEGRGERAFVLRTQETVAPPVYFIAHPGFYERSDALYTTEYGDLPDNLERFAFFSKAALEFLRRLGQLVDIIHINDWQTSLVPIYRRLSYDGTAELGGARTVLTIHNIGYQGLFTADQFTRTGLPDVFFHTESGLEFHGHMNLLKGGILFADAITTVSPTYAQEILTPEQGYGLEGVIQQRAGRLQGILNGIDTEVWNPASDPLIPHQFSAESIAGKRKNRQALRKFCGLHDTPDKPLVAMISRLAAQKGFDLVAGAMETILSEGAQFLLLGTGDTDYQNWFQNLAARHPGQVSAQIMFDNELAHRIEAGADIFLMPSRYEPCGLNQMYSLRYGTIPVVRATGGLADTVVDYTPDGLKDGTSNGFVFQEYSAEALAHTLGRAFLLFSDRRKWLRLARNGMGRDWSWERSASQYVELYQSLVPGGPEV